MGTSLSLFSESIFKRTYSFHDQESWEACAARVAKAIADDKKQEKAFFEIIRDRVFIPGGRYLYSSGREIKQYSNCFGFLAKDSREGWANLLQDVTMCLSMGGGLGVNYSEVREKDAPIRRMGGKASGPKALMHMVNEVARHVMAGGKRRSALWAGLNWNHPDIMDFIQAKDWNDDIKAMKAKNFDFPAPMDMTNMSVIIGNEYLNKLHSGDPNVTQMHTKICEYMLRTGEPAFLNMSLRLKDDPGATTTNACTESTLHPHDTCNLGSVVLPRIKSLEQMETVTRLAIKFLYNGSLKAHYPTDKIASVAQANRRIGLGIMGLHEFMLLHDHKYEWFPKLEQYLHVWQEASDDEAKKYSRHVNEAPPIARRAIAPTGTISIVAETTSGIEPVFCSAYRRRYIDAGQYKFQYVVDPTVRRLIELGVPSKNIEDAYTLSFDVRRRLEVNAQVQRFTDQAISSTVNLPRFDQNVITVPEFADLMKEYLPRLKGITTYPDGARSGQPLSPVSIEEAMSNEGVVFEEDGERCAQGVCGL